MSRLYRRPKFLEVLLGIRDDMAREADYDIDLFVEKARSTAVPGQLSEHEPDPEPEEPKRKKPVVERK